MGKDAKIYYDLVKNPDKRTGRSFVTYKSVMRLKKEDLEQNPVTLEEQAGTGCVKCDSKRTLVPKWEKKRILKKKFSAARCRETELDLQEDLDGLGEY